LAKSISGVGFIKAGFTGGFLGIVAAIANVFVESKLLERLSSAGLYLATFFGKACISTGEVQCTLYQKLTTIVATIVGNCIAYFAIFALVSLAISIIVMWLKPKASEIQVQTQVVSQVQQPQQTTPQVTQEVVQQPQVQQSVEQTQIKQQEVVQEKPKKSVKKVQKRPVKKAKIKKPRN
jgi:hypothetical protein